MRTFGKYRLVEPIASGGMADVWRAEVTGAEGVVKEVALKLVRGEHAARSDFVRMFVREARLASRLSHANVVQVFGFDRIDGRYCIAMELVRGCHLGSVSARAREAGSRFGVARAVHVAAEVAKGLAYAHRASENGRPLGIVHRDVSPHNVLVSFEGEVKLADFGIARAMDQAGFTDPGTVKGKVPYMAPEQARGSPVDARADVFSLGVILWELCAGRRLFVRDSDAATLAAVLGDEPVEPPSAWNEGVPPELDAAVLAALARDPARRTPSAQDLATALAAVLLRVTRSPEDVDLRSFMHRLFAPEVAAAQGPPPEPTRVRPVPVAAEPEAALEDEPQDEATRTVAAPLRAERRGPRYVAGVAIAAGTAAAIAAGIASIRSRAPGAAHATAARAVETPSAAMTPSPRPSPPADAGGEGGPARSTPTPTSTSTPTSTRPLESAPTIGALALPPASSGEGLLRAIAATGWWRLRVNGFLVGETPQEVRLPAGRHRVRIERSGRRATEETVLVSPGERTTLVR